MASASASSGIKPKLQDKQNEDKEKFDNIVKLYLDAVKKEKKEEVDSVAISPELEVRFGTMKQSTPLTKDNVTNIIKKLKSLQFTQSSEEYSLRIFLNDSDVRIQIDGFSIIQNFCIDNTIDEKKNAKMITKKNMERNVVREDGSEYKTDIKPVDNFDFDFRVSLQSERNIGKDERDKIISNWKSTGKNFRYIRRTTFTHPNSPVKIDVSVVKDTFSSSRKSYGDFKTSNIMKGEEKYEVEIEVDNGVVMESGIVLDSLLKRLRESIKMILSGIQSSNFPISNDEKRQVLDEYSKLIYRGEVKPPSRLAFVGPSSVTLQIKNIAPAGMYKMPSIRTNYSVTDKADGLRKLLYVSNKGRIYLIDPLMNVQFTGLEAEIKAFHNTLIDGEHVLHDKDGNFINLYLAFDIYFMKGESVRERSFYTSSKEHADKSRYLEMVKYIGSLDAKSIIKVVQNPFAIQAKRFYFDDGGGFGVEEESDASSDKIFMLCKQCLEADYKYVTDGLIFTPCNTGVGGSAPGQVGPLDRKFTWALSFKWKPPHFNTVDFLVNTVKDDKTNRDKVVDKFGRGGINATNMLAQKQVESYKELILKVGFDPSNRSNKIIPNACALIYEGVIEKMFGGSGEYKPIQFLPSNPYDVNAGTMEIKLNNEGDMVTEEGAEVFEDLTIVEFRYDLQYKKWIPLRIRYDKTADLRKTGKNFGNDYKTADSVWYSIHYPVTENIIKGVDKTIKYEELAAEASDITEVYYKSSDGRKEELTSGLRDFHNKFVKSALIYELSKSGDTLIDFAVGKGGDLPKWKESRLSFVYGIDVSRDNVENPVNGACARYVNFVRENSGKMDAMFVVGNSSRNIKDGSAFSNSSQLTREISNSVFGKGSVDVLKKAGLNGVVANYGKGEQGFDISSIQFAVHYMFENEETLEGFARNVCECTKKGGILIGTTFNGKKVFELLKRNKIKKGESFAIFKGGDKSKKIVEIVKKYDDDLRFPPDENSLGYEIGVWQESINQYISEFMVNFEYFDGIMSKYGFEPFFLENRDGGIFSKSRASFEELFKIMKQNHSKNFAYSKALSMSNEEKSLSFLNDYFIYKKVRDVDCAHLKHAASGVGSSSSLTEKQKTFAMHDKQGLMLTRLADIFVDHKWKQVDINSPAADFAWVGATSDEKKTGFLRYEESIYNIKTTVKSLLKGNGVKGYSTSDPDYPYTKNVITDKAQLYIELNKKCPEICKKYMAESWLLSDEKRTSEYAKSEGEGILIIKPLGVGAGGGEGIEYITSKEDLKEFVATHKKKQYLVSKYIRNPMLIEGKKFHLRMYFMVCMRPNKKSDWFLFDEGKIITAELPYKDADYKNKKIHDTHFKSTKKNRLFPESSELGLDDKESKKIMQQMREVLRCAYDVYKPHIATTTESKYGFEVFGCDFMVTSDGSVKLLEINARHDYGVNDIEKENPEIYERFCGDISEWIYKNAVEPMFLSNVEQTEKYESEHERVVAVIEKGFPFVERFWTKDDVEAAYALIKTKVADVPLSALKKENYIDETSYNILTGNKETEEVNKFIREHVGANDNLKFKSGNATAEFISIKSPDETLLDKDYLLVDYFTESSKITVRLAKGEPSLEDHFKNGTLVEKALRLLKRKSIEPTDESLHEIIVHQSDERTESQETRINMKMSMIDGKDKKVYLSSAENAYVYVIMWKLLFPEMSPEDFSSVKILDGAGGYGSRLMAAIMMNASYVGVEPNPLSTPGFSKMIEMFGSAEKQKMLEDGLPSAVGVENLPFGWADIVMFSPPMWGKEVYNDETVKGQSINMFNNEKVWLKEFLHASIEVLWSRLRVGGYIVFQSVRYDYIGDHMIKEHVEKQKDAEFKGILSRVTTGGRYKPNWVWQKTNGATASSVVEKESVNKGEGEKGEEKGEKKSAIPKKKIVFEKNKTVKKKLDK